MDINQTACGRCGYVITLGTQNAVYYFYFAQPWFSHWIVACPRCNAQSRQYSRTNYKWEYEWAERNEVGIIADMFPSDHIVDGFRQVYDVTDLTVRELTDQDEKNIKFLAWLLNHYDTRFFDDPQRGGDVREEQEIHHIELAIEIIDNKLARISRDKARLEERKAELERRIARRWDVT